MHLPFVAMFVSYLILYVHMKCNHNQNSFLKVGYCVRVGLHRFAFLNYYISRALTACNCVKSIAGEVQICMLSASRT